jgi:hypothetical protein
MLRMTCDSAEAFFYGIKKAAVPLSIEEPRLLRYLLLYNMNAQPDASCCPLLGLKGIGRTPLGPAVVIEEPAVVQQFDLTSVFLVKSIHHLVAQPFRHSLRLLRIPC